MENPNLTFLSRSLLAGDRSLTNVVAHEITHSWAGNYVTNSSWSDFWYGTGHEAEPNIVPILLADCGLTCLTRA